ncbi:hypothetical protein [Amycolatopsis sp. NPDC004625]|uniref:hypothetical protein n=1 Tax=Amycolatopsis sp. NPDC004625 TaxID=3154670 RepID=UPI0033AE0885
MRNAHPARRQSEMDAVELDFDYFGDTTGLAGDSALAEPFDDFADLVDLYAELAEIEDALAELEGPMAPVFSLPIAAPRELGEVA